MNGRSESIEPFAGGGHFGIYDIVVVFTHFVDDAAGCELDDAVADGLYEFVVVASQENVAFEESQGIVECLN